MFDMNSDSNIDREDLRIWVKEIKGLVRRCESRR